VREGCRYKSKRDLSSALGRISEQITLTSDPKVRWEVNSKTNVALYFNKTGGESVSQSTLKNKGFLTFLDQNPPFELPHENGVRLHEHVQFATARFCSAQGNITGSKRTFPLRSKERRLPRGAQLAGQTERDTLLSEGATSNTCAAPTSNAASLFAPSVVDAELYCFGRRVIRSETRGEICRRRLDVVARQHGPQEDHSGYYSPPLLLFSKRIDVNNASRDSLEEDERTHGCPQPMPAARSKLICFLAPARLG
jgi:hypothetical protein